MPCPGESGSCPASVPAPVLSPCCGTLVSASCLLSFLWDTRHLLLTMGLVGMLADGSGSGGLRQERWSWELFPPRPAFLPGGILSVLPLYSWQCSGLMRWPQMQARSTQRVTRKGEREKLRAPRREGESESSREERLRHRSKYTSEEGESQPETETG